MLRRVASGISRDDHRIAILQRVVLHAGVVQLRRSRPLDSPANSGIALTDRDLNDRMRVAKRKLDDFARDGNGLLFIVGGCEGVMGISDYCRHQYHRHDNENTSRFHPVPPTVSYSGFDMR